MTKLNKSHAAAIGIVIVLVLWMLSGLLFRDSNVDQRASGANEATVSTALMKVQVEQVVPSEMNRVITLQGQMEPRRQLSIRSETTGTVTSIPVQKGQRVKTGQLITKLSLDGRDAKLSSARAQLRTAISEEKAAKKLQKQGLQSQLKLEQAQASLARARTELKLTDIDIQNTEILAPFDAILNGLEVEEGQQVERGMVIAELVDDSSFKVTATAAQQTLTNLKLGGKVTAKLITGEELNGTITFVSAVANTKTRSFTVEAEVESSGESAAAGVSASLIVPVESVEAVFVSPSSIALGENGDIGVKTVNDEQVVEFHKVTLLQTTNEGAWVSGVPTDARVITLGQGFVNPGQTVEPVLTADPNAS